MMKRLLPLIMVALTNTGAFGAESVFYLGTYTKTHKSEGIYAGTIDTQTGKLGAITLAAKAENPSYLAISPDGRYVYAAIEASGGAVAAFRAEKDGTLTVLNSTPSGGDGACHVSWSQTKRFTHVSVANYGAGSFASFQVKPDGSLGGRNGFIQLEGSGPDPKRQQSPHAHSIYQEGEFAYICDLGTDNVWIFHTVEYDANFFPADPPSGKVPPAAGPRHLAWSADGKFAYVNNEMAMSVTAFTHPAPGKLEPLQTLSSLPPDTSIAGCSSAAIKCHPSGKWLYVSNRGHESLTVFAIGADGRLSWVDNVPSVVKTPRDFGIDPGGRWLIAAGQNDDRICVFAIDPLTGKLTLTDQSAPVGAPVCVVFAP